MFSGIAPWYDLLNHLLSLNIDRLWRSATARRLRDTDGPILDVCTGTGDLALALDRARGRRGVIIGADFCRPMLVRARDKAARAAALPRLAFIEADAQRLPCPDETFALTTVAFGLRNVTDTDRGLAEMVRVTRPGGRVAVLEFSRPRGLIGWFYRAYFLHLLPLVGQLISRSPDSAYRYLPASVMQFPDGAAMAAKFQAHGLTDVSVTPMTFGIATLYVGRKPAS
jgi:demethylmenaquinone methyltransferase/2-methoxy-6-polyprenyl-1,4-benzoquinol methylase